MVFVNFKTYKEGTGGEAVKLAEICLKVSEASGIKIIPVVQVVDLWHIKQHFKDLEVWVQHLDWFSQGQFTGWINLEAVVEAGASGTLLNHAEHQIPPGTVKQIIKRAKGEERSEKNFKVMVCCRTLGQAERLAKLKPDFLAYEPPELIGSQEKSVASEKPEIIKKIVEMAGIPVIVGAGIHSQEDVRISLKMGAKGILVSTDVVKALDQKKELEDLAKGFK
ncbi:MAG: triose-phosphate isomerase [Patescibacteria group bacterium]